MTENILQKLEEKMMLLVAELEEARKEVERLAHENSSLRSERDRHTKKLNDLVLLLDVVNHEQTTLQLSNNVSPAKPVLVTNETVAS